MCVTGVQDIQSLIHYNLSWNHKPSLTAICSPLDPPLMLQAGDSVNCLPIPPSFLLDLLFNLNMHDIFAAGCQATIDQQILLSSDDDHSLINVYVVVNFCDCVEANLSRLYV